MSKSIHTEREECSKGKKEPKPSSEANEAWATEMGLSISRLPNSSCFAEHSQSDISGGHQNPDQAIRGANSKLTKVLLLTAHRQKDSHAMRRAELGVVTQRAPCRAQRVLGETGVTCLPWSSPRRWLLQTHRQAAAIPSSRHRAPSLFLTDFPSSSHHLHEPLNPR